MRALENENDPRILKELAVMMSAEIVRLQHEIKKIQDQKAKSDQRSFSMEESLLVLRKKFFGRSSEKVTDREKSRKDDDEILIHSQNLIPPVKNKSSKKLFEEDRVHEATEEELKEASVDFGLTNPSADQWQKIDGLFDVSTEIEIIEWPLTE